MFRRFKLRTWNNRKIAFVTILIATSVSFVLLFNRIAPITALPSFKLMAGGQAVKITGYIFGPLVGAITGVISDLITFMISPTFVHWWYTLAWLCAGLIPGIFGYIMHRRWKNSKASIPEDEYKVNNVNMLITILTLVAVIAAIVAFVMLQDDSVFENQKLIKNKFLFLGISVAGLSTMLIAVFIFRFLVKPKTFNAMLPIIAFSAVLEIVNTPLLTLGDMSSFGLNDDFVTLLTAHLLTSPIKIWTNLIIIMIAYSIVSPLIFNKTSNGWDQKTDKKIKLIDEPNKINKKEFESEHDKNKSKLGG